MGFILILTWFPIQFFMPLSLMHPHVIVPWCVVVPHLFYSSLPCSLVGDKTSRFILIPTQHPYTVIMPLPEVSLCHQFLNASSCPKILCVFLPQLSHQRLLRSLLVNKSQWCLSVSSHTVASLCNLYAPSLVHPHVIFLNVSLFGFLIRICPTPILLVVLCSLM